MDRYTQGLIHRYQVLVEYAAEKAVDTFICVME